MSLPPLPFARLLIVALPLLLIACGGSTTPTGGDGDRDGGDGDGDGDGGPCTAGETRPADDGCNTCHYCPPDDPVECLDGDSTDDDCNTCSCSEGQWSCTNLACPPVDGSCWNGDSKVADDGCNTCTCSGGDWVCGTANCEPGGECPEGKTSDEELPTVPPTAQRPELHHRS